MIDFSGKTAWKPQGFPLWINPACTLFAAMAGGVSGAKEILSSEAGELETPTCEVSLWTLETLEALGNC